LVVWRIVSPLGGAENLGETDPLNLKPPLLHNPLSKSNQILISNASLIEVQTLQILWKSRKGYAPAGRLYARFRSNLSKNFNFGGPTPLSLHRWGEKGPLLHPSFTPIGATCRPCGAKNLKIGSE